MTGIASRFNGWNKDVDNMRAVGTRPATLSCRVPKGTHAAPTIDLPAILALQATKGRAEMAGYLCLMPTASVLQKLE
jgi:hypothetical protein